jgi:hypothetical protein
MEWLLCLLRVVFGVSRHNGTDPQPVAVRQDGTTQSLSPESNEFARRFRCWDWLNLILPFDPPYRENHTLCRHLDVLRGGTTPRAARRQTPPRGRTD